MKSNNCVNQFGQVGQKASKNDDFLTKCVMQFGQVGQKASIHTGQKCGPIEKIHIGRFDGGAMELSEICSTCMSTVRHTGQKCGPV